MNRELIELGAYTALTVQNTVPTLLEMVAEIVAHIDDDDLTATFRAKLGAMSIVQDQLNETRETDDQS
jgi:hypothetical protein